MPTPDTPPDDSADPPAPTADAAQSRAGRHRVREDGHIRRSQHNRREATRSSILRAAREEFLERGFMHVSLEDIVRRAGLTRGALYHQFPDKAAVLHAVAQEEAAAMQSRIDQEVVGTVDPLEHFRRGLEIYLDAVPDARMLYLLNVEFPAHCGEDRWTLESPWLQYVEQLLTEAIRRGIMRPVDVRSLARLLLAMYREAMAAIAKSPDQVAARREMTGAVDALLNGLRIDGWTT